MTRKENLIALRDAVLGGDFKNAVACAAGVGNSYVSYNIYSNIMDAYNGDMNAAMAFVAEVLPNDRIRIDTGRRHRAWVISVHNHKTSAYAETPARALLIAALNALIEETDE